MDHYAAQLLVAVNLVFLSIESDHSEKSYEFLKFFYSWGFVCVVAHSPPLSVALIDSCNNQIGQNAAAITTCLKYLQIGNMNTQLIFIYSLGKVPH